MRSCRLYQFEDSKRKRDALFEIIRLLNASGEKRGVCVSSALVKEYESGLENSPVRLSEAVERALQDADALILLDLRLYPKSYAEAGRILLDRFVNEIPDLIIQVEKVIQELPWMNQIDHFYFAAVVLVLAHHFGRALFIASIVREVPLKHRVASQIVAPELFLKFPDQPSDIPQICSTARTIATKLGIDANSETEKRLVEDRVIQMGECIRALLYTLMNLEVGKMLSASQLQAVHLIWEKLGEESKRIAPRLATEVFESIFSKSILKLTSAAHDPHHAKSLTSFAASLIRAPIFSSGAWQGNHPLISTLAKIAGSPPRIKMFGDFADRLFLDSLRLSLELSGLTCEIQFTNQQFSLPNSDGVGVLFWSYSCQKKTLRAWLSVLDVAVSDPVGRTLWFLSYYDSETSFCRYLSDSGGHSLRRESLPELTVLPGSQMFRPKPISSNDELASEIVASIMHGAPELERCSQYLKRICPWLPEVKLPIIYETESVDSGRRSSIP